ncbi:DUF6382 domain-containing protein [Desulfosporosinus sp. HMP52]|uniref:DUF6382 domain-containing protein n=1 Tax=Desulfosporosinus sp. HMP52 TaxID=1487923 RepID=UPI00068D24AD|nr:DUF6382 domain-containing protein [Desulfosporosinus sp. HMP52]
MGSGLLGFSYDYEESARGRLLIVGTDQIEANRLVDAGVHMLKSHTITGVLPLEVEFTNMKAKLCYLVKGRKTLAELLKGRKLSLQEFIKILSQILTAINESPRFFLNETNYIIDINYIFSTQDYDIGLIYLPLTNLENKDSAFDEVKNNIVSVLYAHIDDQYAIKAKSIFEEFLSEEYSLMEINERLKRFNNPLPSPPRKHESNKSIEPISPSRANSMDLLNNKAPQQKFPDEPFKPNSKPDKSKQKNPVKGALYEEKPTPGVKRGLNSKERKILVTLAVLFILLYWIGFVLFGKGTLQEGILYIAIGLTILTADGTFAAIKLFKKMDIVPMSAKKEIAASAQQRQPQIATHTTSLGNSNATVALCQAYFDVESGTQKGRIELNRLPFLVGRGKPYEAYVIEDGSVSGEHARIEMFDGQYVITDLASTNGTYVHGSRLESNQPYPICDGDTIRMGRTEFIFHIGM